MVPVRLTASNKRCANKSTMAVVGYFRRIVVVDGWEPVVSSVVCPPSVSYMDDSLRAL